MVLAGHFLEHELQCHGRECCDRAVVVSTVLLAALELFRIQVATPFTPECVYRCPVHNKAIGGSDTSQHILGTAADIHTSQLGGGWTVGLMAKAAEEVIDILDVPGGIGLYPWGIHLDVREYSGEHGPARWDDRD